MSSMGSMPEVKVAKEDSDAIIGLGWVAWFGLIQFYLMPLERCVCFVVCYPTISTHCKPLYIPFTACGPPTLFACSPLEQRHIKHECSLRSPRTAIQNNEFHQASDKGRDSSS